MYAPFTDDYQCGPASVEAIRRGEVGFGYDVAFVFAEVNADVCHFISDQESHWGFTRSKLNKYQYVQDRSPCHISPSKNSFYEFGKTGISESKLHTIFFPTLAFVIQGDPSACSKPPVDLKMRFAP